MRFVKFVSVDLIFCGWFEMIVALERERIQGTGERLANGQGSNRYQKVLRHRVIHPVS